jgi:hypothetical protein
MQHLAHLMLVEKDVSAAIVGNQEAVAIWMALYLAQRQAGALGQNVVTLAVAHQLAFALHGTQPALEHFPLTAGNIQQLGNSIKLKGRPSSVKTCEMYSREGSGNS